MIINSGVGILFPDTSQLALDERIVNLCGSLTFSPVLFSSGLKIMAVKELSSDSLLFFLSLPFLSFRRFGFRRNPLELLSNVILKLDERKIKI